ncbi:MAG: zinc-dependent alcohol dehydrogenase family protein [Verrucomicrobia bacterium]|nr:zinc-dependent alcohol dehydrogenase family protein [Verrucomicrobiota bacterium]
MKAAILQHMGLPRPYVDSRPLIIEAVDLDPPGPGEVLIQLQAAGLCHSDLSVINGDRPRPIPMVLGHEAAGRVLECAPDVRDLKPGDHVVLTFIPSCGYCLPCMEGRPALCEPAAKANLAGTLLSGERRLNRKGAKIHHHLGVSAFAEYAVVSRRTLVKIDDTISSAEAALFGCAVLTGVGAVINTAKVPGGSSVAIVGLGGVGLNCLLGAVLIGARQIVAVDVNPAKLELARQLGATDTVVVEPEVVQNVQDLTNGGVEFSFELAGSAAALDVAYRITKRGGITVSAGLPHPDRRLSIAPTQLVAEERTLKGSYFGSSVPSRDIPRYIALYQRGLLPIDKLMSHRLRLEEINFGFDRLAEGRAIRQIIDFAN